MVSFTDITDAIEQQLGVSTNVTLKTLSLGNADNITGWYAKTFADSTIKMPILPKGSSLTALPIGLYSRYEQTGWTSSAVTEGSEILDGNSNYYLINSVIPIYLGATLFCYQVELVKPQLHAVRPATYGTGASVDDPRKRTKIYLDTYLTAANMKKDDGTTNATFITHWDGADYPLSKVFIGKSVDLIFSIGRSQSKPLLHPAYPAYGAVAGSEGVYGYMEKLPIDISTVDKTAITGENLKWQAERELRRILETYPYGSKREIDTFDHKPVDLGGLILHSLTVEMNYKRGVT